MKNFLILPSLIMLLIIATGCSDQSNGSDNQSNGSSDQSTSKTDPVKTASASQSRGNSEMPMSSAETVADKLEVYYFHSNARCVSCRTIGQYVKETMEQSYSQQIAEGKIDYREINVEESENFDIASKFRASGSSLKINKIIGEQDNIEEDKMVWRLMGDEDKFKSYLITKIDSYLGL
jgi:hypothetical protein